MIRHLGRVATILAKCEAVEIDLHADVDAWHAPSECHTQVSRGEVQRMRLARRRAEALAGRPYRIIARELETRGCPIGSYRWQALVDRCVRHPSLTGRP
jgi:hypothetical protein